MGDSRVVLPDTRTLHISNGDWLLVKKRLNAGDHRRMVKRGSPLSDEGRRPDSIEAGLATVLAYLLDWSLKGTDGAVIPIRGGGDAMLEAALDAIDPESYTEILRAVEAHADAMEKERAEEKKLQAGATGVAPISPSPSAVAVDPGTSVN